MIKSKYILISVLFCIFFNYSFSQNSDTINLQLKTYLSTLEQYTFTDTLTVQDLFLLTKRSKYRKLYIKQLQNEITQIQSNIFKLKKYINKLNTDLQHYKQTYAQLLKFLYINKIYIPSTFNFLLSAKTLNQLYLRLRYLQLVTEYLKSVAQTIQSLKRNLEYQKKIMSQSLILRKKLVQKLLHQKALYQEDFILLKQIQNSQTLYQALKQNIYQYEIRRKLLLAEVLKNILPNKTQNSQNLNSGFENYKGQLPAPLNNAVVLIPFGIHEHKNLKNIKIRNDGVDLISTTDSVVKAVFKGTVSKIIQLPNSRYAVIIKHGQYFTVYSNLSKVSVSENQPIKQGQKLGIIRKSKSQKYPVLNFQIWHLTNKLNPQNWILL